MEKFYFSRNIPTLNITFEDFYQKFEVVDDITKSKEWKEVFSNYYSFDGYELEIETQETSTDIEEYDQEKQVDEIIKCSNSFSYFCHKYLKIAHPIKGLIPFILFNYQRRVISEYEKHRFNILKKFRQGGLTTVSVLWALWRAMFSTNQMIMVVSKTDREAIAAGEIVRRAMDHMPSWLKPNMGDNNKHERQFVDTGSTLWFYTPEAARGKSITLLIIDEAAFVPDMEKHWAALYPVISTGGACCIVSTVNGMGNWYQEKYYEAESDENSPFNAVNLNFWEHPEYNSEQWEKDTRGGIGEKKFEQEYLGSFQGSGSTYIPMKIISNLDKETKERFPLRIKFEKWYNKSEKRFGDWEDGALWIWKEPISGHEYIIGVDCAEGVELDNSCFQILDINTMEQVAEFYSNSIPPHLFSQIINEIGYFYNTALIVVENLNQGGAVLSSLQNDLAYENVYHEDGKSPGLKTTRHSRPLILETLQHKLMNDNIKINSRRLVSELHTFIFNPRTKKPEAQKTKHDDAILALSFALYVKDVIYRDMPVGANLHSQEEFSKIFKTQIYEEIKKEILEGSIEDWLDVEKDYKPLFPDENEEVYYDVRRRYDKILNSFGW